jgi:hypothetical protein
VENGKVCPVLDECDSEVEYGFENSTTNGMSIEGSAGAYLRNRARSFVEFSASAGHTGGREDSTTITYTQADKLYGSRDGTIMAYYYVPTFTVTKLD